MRRKHLVCLTTIFGQYLITYYKKTNHHILQAKNKQTKSGNITESGKIRKAAIFKFKIQSFSNAIVYKYLIECQQVLISCTSLFLSLTVYSLYQKLYSSSNQTVIANRQDSKLYELSCFELLLMNEILIFNLFNINCWYQ